MGTALLYGALASSSFVVGVLIGLTFSPTRKVVATVVAFGAGVLVSALTFELMREVSPKNDYRFAVTMDFADRAALRFQTVTS